MKWIYLYFPQLQLDRFHKDIKDLLPLVIINEKVNEVVQLNILAHQSGIRMRMGLASSMAFSDELKIVAYDFEKEVSELHRLAKSIYSVASDIFLDPPQGIYLNIDPLQKLYKSQEKLWSAIEKAVTNYEVNYHFSLSYSALSAKLLAHARTDKLVASKVEATFLLKQLPIQALNYHQKIQQAFIRIGIKSIKQLLAISVKELAIRFDLSVINSIRHLKGEIKQPLTAFYPETVFNTQQELMFEINNSIYLEKPITKLLQQLERFLTKSNLTTQNIKLSFSSSGEDCVHMQITSAAFQANANKWMELVKLKLEKLKLKAPIRSLSLETSQLHKQSSRTLDMLTTKEGNLEKAEFISILQAKLGTAAISQLNYKPEYFPEKSTLLSHAINDSYESKLITQTEVAARPALLLGQPIPLNEKVELMSLPERIQSNWWDKCGDTRDYFMAKNELQQWYWVFRHPDNKWYLHGYFC